MQRILIITLCLITFIAYSASAAHTVTFYRDGALHQQEAAAVKGVVDIPLAENLIEQTLSVIPAPGTTILNVEPGKTESAGSNDKSIEALTEQRRRLEDRLQALDTREAIFTAAAKAQSGKAPRKTKANPDPLKSIRQGTDFAIAQLEAVYTSRRKTVQEIRKIDSRLAAAGREGQTAGSSIRIRVTPGHGKVTLRYATSERGWQPQYNLHLTGDGSARLQLSARLTGLHRGYQSRVSSGSLSESAAAESFPLLSGGTALTDYRMPITEEVFSEGVFKRFSGKITNNSSRYLPPGESGLFRNGTYLGKFRFEGISSGRSKAISVGK